jgi:hypothetical protein
MYATKLTEDQFNFKSKVRGEVLEDIMAITIWKRIATVLSNSSILGNTTKAGVIENLILEKEAYIVML